MPLLLATRIGAERHVMQHKTFTDFMRSSATQPNLLRSPYTEEDRRILAYLAWLKYRLATDASRTAERALVSVIMPTFRRPDVLARAMFSVLTQSHERLQLIVVDDGSKDDTGALVRSFADRRVTLIKSEVNRGNAAARNEGLAAASGEFVAFLDDDDWWDADFLRILLSTLKLSGRSFTYSAQRVLRPILSEQSERPELIRFAPYNRSLLENTNYISMISVLIRRSDITAIGGFDESLPRFVDWDFFLRLSLRSSPVANPAILSTYNQQAANSVSSTADREKALLQLREKLTTRRLTGVGLTIRRDAPTELRERIVETFSSVSIPMKPPSSPSSTSVTIVIPSFEAVDYLRLCVDSIDAFTQRPYNVVIVDNASGAAVQSELNLLAKRSNYKIIRNERNMGFTYAVNQGLLCSSEGPAVLMNNDALVTEGWLESLINVAESHEDIGIVAPRQVLFSREKTMRTHVPAIDETFEGDTNLSAHHENVLATDLDGEPGLYELNFAPFFCVLITRNALNRCGLLDYENAPHFRSDRVYCDAVRNWAKLRIVYTPHSKVYHFHNKSTQELGARNPDLHRLMRAGVDWQAIARSPVAEQFGSIPAAQDVRNLT
jgi:O-antigen biosynthesis protein